MKAAFLFTWRTRKNLTSQFFRVARFEKSLLMLEEYLSRSEGKTLEFKENTRGVQAIVKTVVAFANSSGGTIIIGVKDRTKDIDAKSEPFFSSITLKFIS